MASIPAAITAALPETTGQTRILHRIRHSMSVCGWKDRKPTPIRSDASNMPWVIAKRGGFRRVSRGVEANPRCASISFQRGTGTGPFPQAGSFRLKLSEIRCEAGPVGVADI